MFLFVFIILTIFFCIIQNNHIISQKDQIIIAESNVVCLIIATTTRKEGKWLNIISNNLTKIKPISKFDDSLKAAINNEKLVISSPFSQEIQPGILSLEIIDVIFLKK